MPKQNSAILLNRYIWLIDTIYSAGSISRAEIDRRWCRSMLSEGEMSIPPRTFHRWRIAIEELFQINIGFSKTRGYFIENTTDYQRQEMRKWLLSTFSINNLINEGTNLRQYICFEDIPSGQRFLSTILEAVRDRQVLWVTHQGFAKPEPSTFCIKPYGLKVFKQRWYVLAESEYPDHRLLVYGLDRFERIERTDEHYVIPEEFDIGEYFSGSYGITGAGGTPELIKLKVNARQRNYLRTLPLHSSQKEVETTDEYSVFQFHLAPSFELRQEILGMGASAEVLAPESLREEIKEEIEKMNTLYN